MALFLAYLGAITGDPSPTRLAQRALISIRAQLRASLGTGREGKEAELALPTVGAFDGLSSIIYLLTNLAVLWADSDLLNEAEKLVERLPSMIWRDEHLDIIYGSAGCILALLSLHAVRPSPRCLKIAIQCGEHLLATAQQMREGTAWRALDDQPPLGGFSHGTAGFAFALLQLAVRSGQSRFLHSALEALAYDRSLFVPELNNWADLRAFPAEKSNPDYVNRPAAGPTRKSMVAWCHGASGIGLARLGALDVLGDQNIREEIDAALNATVDYGFDINHSLCHGGLGNIELLLMAARLLNRPQDHEALARATAAIVASIEANGWVTGVPLGVETPGFMTGLAGMGYELLRLGEPDKLPSVLLMAPPCWQAQHGRKG
jgi:type 2 lantibiotic biosynthesis protein LanM